MPSNLNLRVFNKVGHGSYVTGRSQQDTLMLLHCTGSSEVPLRSLGRWDIVFQMHNLNVVKHD